MLTPANLRGFSLQRSSNEYRLRPVSTRIVGSLDWFVFFVADIQTGFGPFVAVFLTTQKWTQVDIGLVLTVSGLVSLVGQIPFGALVDAARSVRAVAAFALVAIGASALAFAAWPIFPVVLASRVIHAAASSMLGLALVSISLGVAGESGMSERLGRNAAFASAGTGSQPLSWAPAGIICRAAPCFFLPVPWSYQPFLQYPASELMRSVQRRMQPVGRRRTRRHCSGPW